MKNEKRVNQAALTALDKDKVKDLGFFERLSATHAGKKDGTQGLPRQNASGEWEAPFLQRKQNAFDEYASKRWGALQIRQAPDFARLSELVDSIQQTAPLLMSARAALEAASTAPPGGEVFRRSGEDRLTDDQVAARRASERASKRAKELAPLQSRAAALQSKLESEFQEMAELQKELVEEANSTRAVCSRVRAHVYMIIDVYWNATLRNHTHSDQMPVLPAVEIFSDAEERYAAPHKQLMQEVDTIIETLSVYFEEEAA